MQCVNDALDPKPSNMSWRDYNANIWVYNKCIAPKLNLAKRKTKFTKMDNNMMKRAAKIVEGLSYQSFYSVPEVKDALNNYFINTDTLDRLIVPRRDLVQGKCVPVLENAEVSEKSNMFRSCLGDAFSLEEDELKEMERDPNLKNIPKEVLIREVKKRINATHRKTGDHLCQARRGVCKITNYKEYAELLCNKLLESNEALRNVGNRSALMVSVHKYLEGPDFQKDCEALNSGQLLLKSERDMQDLGSKLSTQFQLHRSVIRVLTTEEDFAEYCKIKGFSKSAYSRAYRSELRRVAEDMIHREGAKNPSSLRRFKYNVTTMRIELDNTSLNYLNSELNKQKPKIQLRVLHTYGTQLKDDNARAAINKNKLIDSIKYILLKTRFRRNHYKMDRRKILQMKRSEIAAALENLVSVQFLNRKTLEVKKGLRNFLRGLVLYSNFDDTYFDSYSQTLKVVMPEPDPMEEFMSEQHFADFMEEYKYEF